jgi:hypothetical protein
MYEASERNYIVTTAFIKGPCPSNMQHSGDFAKEQITNSNRHNVRADKISIHNIQKQHFYQNYHHRFSYNL